MKGIDLLSISLRNLWRRKLRTFLTVLGVVIGATSIIIMISLGLAIEKSQMDIVESMGDLKTITIYDPQYYSDKSGTKAPPLNDSTINNLKTKKHVQHIYGIKEGYIQGTIKLGKYELWGSIVGVDPQYFEDFEKSISDGRLLVPNDKYSFLLPGSMKYSLWDYKTETSAAEDPNFDMLQEKFSITLGWDDPGSKTKKIKANIVGILDTQDWNMYTTMDSFEQIMAEQKKIFPEMDQDKKETKSIYDRLELRADSLENVKPLQEELRDEGYPAESMVDFSESMQEGQLLIQAVLGGIGSISFVVAAIGIANTMIMSIYERTREIGVMKVIGASVSDIRNIFLVEALLIGLSGGLIGVALSLLISKVLNHVINLNYGLGMEVAVSVIPLYLVLAGLFFSAFVGLLSGYFPAQRATKLSAIEAIKTE